MSGLRYLDKLTALDLSTDGFQGAITDVALAPIGHCRQLKRRRLGGGQGESNWRVTDAGMRSILHTTQHLLTELQADCFMSLHNAGMAALTYPRLTKLQLRCCHGLTEAGVESMSRACRNLQVLDLSFKETDYNETPLSTACIRSITQHCTKLAWLDISEAMELLDSDVSIIAANLPHLVGLDGILPSPRS